MDLVRDINCVITIVEYPQAEKVKEIATHHHCGGNYTIFAKGTISNRLSNFLGIEHDRRQLVITILQDKYTDDFMDELSQKLKFENPGHGIALSIPINRLAAQNKQVRRSETRKEEETMNNSLIITIVDYKDADTIIKAARQAGAIGATIVKGHGTAGDQIPKLLGFHIEPEKELVFMVVESTIEEQIISAIKEVGLTNQAIKPVVFSLDVKRVSGIMSQEMVDKLVL